MLDSQDSVAMVGDRICPSGGIGRRCGLKIRFPLEVRVQVPPRALFLQSSSGEEIRLGLLGVGLLNQAVDGNIIGDVVTQAMELPPKAR